MIHLVASWARCCSIENALESFTIAIVLEGLL